MSDRLTRHAALTPASFDETALTVEAIISTYAPVQRRDSRGAFVERLDPKGLETSRLVGAPVLDGHRQGSARDAVGVVTAYRFEDNALAATLRFTDAPDAAPIVARIRQGVVRGVSIGYRVQSWAESVDPKTQGRVRTAAAWSIDEVSAVPVPADPGAIFRSKTMEHEEDVIDAPAEPTVAETRAAIRQIARAAGMNTAQADDMVDRELSITEARAEAWEHSQTRRHTAPNIRTAAPQNDDPNVIRQRREEALYARTSGVAPSAEARPFMGETLRDMARASVEALGRSTRGMDLDTLFRAAVHTTSDFPQLLTGVGRRTLMAASELAGSPLKSVLARQTTLPDFRAASKLKLSDIGLLEKVGEAGEIRHTMRGEASESYALDTYATQFSLSRKAQINDDLGALTDWAATAGRMSAQTENKLLFEVFRQANGAGPVMNEDGKRLFHSDHGNLAATGIPLSDDGAVEALSEARKGMRTQKAQDKVTPIAAAPKYLLVGPESETAAEQVLADIYSATVPGVNPFSGKLELLVEPRITDLSWYLFADPASLPVLEYAYLSSAQGPQMASREGWDVLGLELRVVLDFGCGATDWRGVFRNKGQ